MGIFIVLSAVISFALAKVFISQGVAKDIRATSSQITALLNQASTSNYAELSSGAFARPQACADDPSVSCVQIGPVDLDVQWDVIQGDDLSGNRSLTGSSVTLSASTVLPNGKEVTHSKVISAPYPGWRLGEGAVRVSNLSENYDGAVYLMSASGEVVDSAFLEEGAAILRGSPESCLPASPCKVALDDVGRFYTETSTLSIQDTGAYSTGVVIRADTATDITINVRSRADAEVQLTAVSDGNSYQGSPVLNSVCLWATITDGSGSSSLPACNSSDSKTVSFGTFTTSSGAMLALPVGSDIKISVDSPSGRCEQVPGMVGHTAAGWVPSAVCTSWTWGAPSALKIDGSDVDPLNNTTELTSEGVKFEMVWSGPTARPAAGYGSQETWVKARDVQPCSTDGSCMSTTDIPESITCPELHCFSSVDFLPIIDSPLLGDAKVVGVNVASGNSPVSLTFKDEEGEPFQVLMGGMPISGALTLNGAPLAAGMPLADFVGTGALTFNYSDTSPNVPPAFFNLVLKDATGVRGARVVEVALSQGPSAWSLASSTKTVKQAAEVDFEVKVTGTNGMPIAGRDVIIGDLPANITSSALSVASDPNGVATFKLNTDNTPSGSYPVVFTSDGRSSILNVVVVGSTSSLTASLQNNELSVQALDKTGAALPGRFVSVSILRDGESVRGVWAQKAACLTSSETLDCKTMIITEDGATFENLEAVLTVGGITQTVPLVGLS